MTDFVAASITAPAAQSNATGGLPPGYVHNLRDLQAEALEQYGMSPAETLAAAQRLYERNLITYPMTEERRLASYMFEEASSIIVSYRMASGSREHDPEYQAPCWEDDLQLHMGIMVRGVAAAALFGVSLSEAETRVYRLVHSRFLSLFVRPAA